MNAKDALLLIDDGEARKVARKQGLLTKGTIGILVEAFEKGLIDLEEIEFLLVQVQAKDDIWISRALCEEVLTELKVRELN